MNEEKKEENRTSLKRQVDIVNWDMLAPHMEKGQFFVIGQELDFLDTAVCIADDNIDQVKEWIDSEQMKRPTPQELDQWSTIEGKEFRFVIVKPFVLIQEVFSS